MNPSPLKYIPVPALLVRKDKHEILEGNRFAAEILNIPAGELSGVDATNLFPLSSLKPGEHEGVFFKANRDHQFEVNITVSPFENEGVSCNIGTIQKKHSHLRDLMEGTRQHASQTCEPENRGDRSSENTDRRR